MKKNRIVHLAASLLLVAAALVPFGAYAQWGFPLSASPVNGTQVSLYWGYGTTWQAFKTSKVYRDGNPIYECHCPSFTDSGLTPGTTYQYQIIFEGYWDDS